MMSGDFDAIKRAFELPALFGTFEGETSIDTPQSLAERFESVRAHHRSMRVTELLREIIDCDWQDDDTIHATYRSRLMSGNILVQAPFNTLARLKKINGEWKCTSMLVAIPDSDEHVEAFLGAINWENAHD